MACHPDLVIRSKNNASKFIPDDGEATVCRICNDIAEDAIQSKCHHIFDRECIKQYLETAMDSNVRYLYRNDLYTKCSSYSLIVRCATSH
jgi:DNA repair protein RAD16